MYFWGFLLARIVKGGLPGRIASMDEILALKPEFPYRLANEDDVLTLRPGAFPPEETTPTVKVAVGGGEAFLEKKPSFEIENRPRDWPV